MKTAKFLLTGFLFLATAAVSFSGSKKLRIATDFNNDGKSLTGGIQEAIDSLPAEGGQVFIPEGQYLLESSVRMKANVKLIGSGKSTVLKKNPGFKILLTEDAGKGQDFVVAANTAKLKEGMIIAVGDRKNRPTIWNGMFAVRKIEGQKVFIKHFHYTGGKLKYNVSVKNGGCLMNLFPVILAFKVANSLIQDMEIDGSADIQPMKDILDYQWSYGMLWCGIYPCSKIRIERCWIHDCGIGLHLNGGGTEVNFCHVYNNKHDGIHCGGGPDSIITNCRVYNNGNAGIFFCFGNRKLIVTNNHIFKNNKGIMALGSGNEKADSTADRYTIVSNNMLYENLREGICSGQGKMGPRDFVISNNIVMNNNLIRHTHVAATSSLPSGICLFNAERCIITNNRVMDDQDMFPRKLVKNARKGEKVIYTIGMDQGAGTGSLTLIKDRFITISDSEHKENVMVDEVKLINPVEIKLKTILRHDYKTENKATAIGTKTQNWGIFAGGKNAVDNIISGNICRGNLTGGILWQGKNIEITGNIGSIVKVNESISLKKNAFPENKK